MVQQVRSFQCHPLVLMNQEDLEVLVVLGDPLDQVLQYFRDLHYHLWVLELLDCHLVQEDLEGLVVLEDQSVLHHHEGQLALYLLLDQRILLLQLTLVDQSALCHLLDLECLLPQQGPLLL